ncbi:MULTISPECIES: MarR family winged helix-turn-helix transcriptional regulator [unclassified Streptomyces]|uniref:MarR family winged helix-turn-helix transcriptional regulator n=2 Tax=Streptomyces TaxID=1883 RepID=UPI0001B53EEA|nr:transcriptional regulator [Streptomyces sp. SPB78]SCD47857.1 DNA-binding transcriptional regulator, MarR family [Streptomyces sp. TverLS-915]SCE88275.1 DNA-binding transcriptional regulator, MarR family [Streptomyces sp. LcepLS]
MSEVAGGCGPAGTGRAPLGAMVVRVARLHRVLAGQLLREVGLHVGQELVMLELWERGRLRQVDLAEVLGAEAATVTRTVRRLEQAGFVRRVPSPTDRRSVLVEATVASLGVRRRVEELWDELESWLTEDLGEDEKAESVRVLERLEERLLRRVEPGGKD